MTGLPVQQVAVCVDDIDAALADFATRGAPGALRGELADCCVWTFADTNAALGHMTERYAPTPSLTGFYAMVADFPRNGKRERISTIWNR